MKVLNGLQKRLHNYSLGKKLKNSESGHGAVNFSQAKKIGVLFISGNKPPTVISNFAKALEKENKEVTLLGFLPKAVKNKQPHPDFPFFTKSDLNFFLQPKKPEAVDFQNRDFDILINAYEEDALPLEFISSLSKARFRIGPYKDQKTHYCDFMLHTEKNQSNLQQTLEQLLHYLKKINTRDE